MNAASKPLTPDDFPLLSAGEKIFTKGGRLVATAVDAPIAQDLANRLNRDQEKSNEDVWSA